MVATADPLSTVGGGEQSLGLGAIEERDDGWLEALRWDGEHACDEGGVFGMAQRGEPEQRVDRGQAGVSTLSAVAASVFEMLEKRADGGGVEIVELQP